MASDSARRNLAGQMTAANGPLSYAKMAAAHPNRSMAVTAEDSIADQDLLSPHTPGTVHSPQPLNHSPASTESLLLSLQTGLPATPTMDPQTGLLLSVSEAQEAAPTPTDFPSMMEAFALMLSKSLAQNAAQITSSIHADIQQLFLRLDYIEQKADQAGARINQNTARIQEMQDQLETAFAKIDDLENRSRRYNFRVRGLPEAEQEVQSAVKDLMKDLIPGIPEYRLELDRAHRALQPPRKDGLPRDIIVKPHFYAVKEEVMRKARNIKELSLHGHKIQIFADLSLYTVQRRRSLKPLLLLLQERDIPYRRSFPLRLNFTYKGRNCAFSTFPEGEHLLLQLGLIDQNPSSSQSSKGTPSSTKRPPPASPLQPSWMKQGPKRSKENLPT